MTSYLEFAYLLALMSVTFAILAINYKLKAGEDDLKVIELLEKSTETWLIAYTLLFFVIIFLLIRIYTLS